MVMLWWVLMIVVRELRSARSLECSSTTTSSSSRARSEMFGLMKRATGPELDSLVGLARPLRSAKEYTIVLGAYGRTRQAARAVELVEEMRESGIESVVSYNAAIAACTRAKAWRQGLEIFDSIRNPDVVSFNSAIAACDAGGRWERALCLVAEMRDRGLEPDAVSYTSAMAACGKAKRGREAVALLAEMRDSSVEPTIVTLNVAISACGDAETAEALFEEAKGLGPNAFTFNSAIAACGDWRRALKILEEMRASGIPPDVVSYNAVMAACEQSGEWARALEVFEGMEATPNVVTYSTAIAACKRGGRCSRALAYLNEMRGRGLAPNVVTYTAAVGACDTEAALRLVAEMRAAGVEPNARTYASAARACARERRWEVALGLLVEMRGLGIAPTLPFFNAAIAACADHPRAALKAFDEMRASRLRPEVSTYAALVSACAGAGAWDKVRAIRETMRAEGIEPDAKFRSAVASAVGPEQCGRVPAEPGDQLSYAIAISACGKAGCVAEVAALVRKAGDLADPPMRAAAISYCARAGDSDLGVRLFREATTAGAVDATLYSAAIKAAARAGDWETALSIFEEARDLFRVVTRYLAGPVISACDAAGESEKAEKVVVAAWDAYAPRWTPHGLDLLRLSSAEARALLRLALLDARRRPKDRFYYSGAEILVSCGAGRLRAAVVDLLDTDDTLRECFSYHLLGDEENHRRGRRLVSIKPLPR